jgi:hypothetical protein
MQDLVKQVETTTTVETTQTIMEIAKSAFEQVRNGSVKEGINVVPTLYKFAIGEKLIGLFMGFKTISIPDEKTGEMKETPAVIWVSELNGTETLIAHMGKMVRDTFSHVPPQTLFSIELTRIEEMKGGRSFKHYSIKFFS